MISPDILCANSNLWLKLARPGTIPGMAAVQQAAGLLRSEYHLAAADASKLLSEAGYSVNDISSAMKSVYNLSANDAASVAEANPGRRA
jgi:hypothetical protein